MSTRERAMLQASLVATMITICVGGTLILLFDDWSRWATCAYVKATLVCFMTTIYVGYRYIEVLTMEIHTNAEDSTKLQALVNSLFPMFQDQVMKGSRISQVYEDCTVMFADIVGFSAWASERGHDQVFHLLESLYDRFDKVAKELDVFKVETVGDSYLAVAGTGLPRKQQRTAHENAEIVAQFALVCIEEMNAVTNRLNASLGPGTGDLTLRIGLHSGTITGGVLRGDRPRFQIFGDAVNMASRLETTSLPNCIQISSATAELLKKADHASWISERKDIVHAKGKGDIQAYWCHPMVMDRLEIANDFMTPSPSAVGWGNTSIGKLPTSKADRHRHLIDYNTEVLTQLLRKVVTKRNAMLNRPQTKACEIENNETYNKEKDRYKGKSTIMDQISEVVPFADFFPEGDVPLEELSDVVKEQIREFVSDVASGYNDVPFHNFEHASHVMLSTVKLLNRIILPQNINIGDEHESNRMELQRRLHCQTFGISSDPLLHFAVAMASLVHDLGHLGLPNKQLIRLKTAEAIKYEGRCVAEQHSIFLSREVVMAPKFAELRSCIFGNDPAEIMRYRKFLVNTVLATDICDKELRAMRQERWAKAFGGERPEASCAESKVDSDRKATIVLDHIIQASDIAHTMQHWQIYIKFNRRLFREMYSKFVAGESDEDPRKNWYKGEIGFFDFYIIPLAQKLWECGVFGYCGQEYLSFARENRRLWEIEGKELAASMQRESEAEFGLPPNEVKSPSCPSVA